MKKILFVCTQNRVRSLTAEHLFQGRNGWQTASAGISAAARVELTEDLLRWADLVVFMEQSHQDYTTEVFAEVMQRKPGVCLNVQDIYYYDEPELKAALEKAMQPFV